MISKDSRRWHIYVLTEYTSVAVIARLVFYIKVIFLIEFLCAKIKIEGAFFRMLAFVTAFSTVFSVLAVYVEEAMREDRARYLVTHDPGNNVEMVS